jgi:hypothetical protein
MKKVIFAIITMVFLPIPSAQAAVLYFVPELETIPEGEVVSVAVMIDTQGETIRDIELYYSYPEDLFEPTAIDLSGSILQSFTEATGDGLVAADGKVKVIGSVPPPGFSGVERVAAVRFRAKASSGMAQLSLDPVSVAKNAEGENILNVASLKPATYTLEKVHVPEEPESSDRSGLPLWLVIVVVANGSILLLGSFVFIRKMRQG